MEEVDPKAVHFSRVATKHTRAALAAIRRLENLTAPRYHSTPLQRQSILTALEMQMKDLEFAFSQESAPEQAEFEV